MSAADGATPSLPDPTDPLEELTSLFTSIRADIPCVEIKDLAGKLRAILQRNWPKGRDLFDLFWYVSEPTWPEPNFPLLNNALKQTGWPGPLLDQGSWKTATRERVKSIDWDPAERDAAPFLEPGSATALFGRENLLRLLER